MISSSGWARWVPGAALAVLLAGACGSDESTDGSGGGSSGSGGAAAAAGAAGSTGGEAGAGGTGGSGGGSTVCPPGETACGLDCVDTQSDPDHCGDCNNACTDDQVCSEGVCADSCASGLTDCGGACVDTDTNPDHCGACDSPCPSGATCAGGMCDCPTGTDLCDGECVDTQSDPDHCGACNSPCAQYEVCQSGACVESPVSGELMIWHKVTLTFDGPDTSEDADPNPFRDYRLSVTFTKGSRAFTVPGYFAADGRAADTGATAGSKWRVHFMPDEVGDWIYSVSFRSGSDVALTQDPASGVAVAALDGQTGTLTIGPSDKTGRDFRSKGLLAYDGSRYLSFKGTGGRFIKGGADSPENFLGYYEFDDTEDHGGSGNDLQDGLHRYEPHEADWNAGDPTWAGGKGKGIIGALNYLAGKDMNSVYFLTMNVEGDGREVYPWTGYDERFRFDVSKLDQWEAVFEHMTENGLMLHVLTQETENDQLLDGGSLGPERTLYYRELIARFGHHPALQWNLGEENTNTDQQRKDFASFFEVWDPYGHPVVIHTYPGQKDEVYTPLLGYPDLDGPSLQGGGHATILEWIERSKNAGRPWFVCLDEIGPASLGVVPDGDSDDPDHDGVREDYLWGTLMAGGAGVEWYFGYQKPHNDLDCEDFRTRDQMWDQTRHALAFFHQYLPFWEMESDDSLASKGHTFAKSPAVFAVYARGAAGISLDLGGLSGDYDVRWYDPRNGGSLQSGSVSSIAGGDTRALGDPPSSAGEDWVVLVTCQGTCTGGGTGGGGTGGSGGGSGVDVSLTLINADTDQPVPAYDPVASGETFDLSEIGTPNLTLRANASGVGSVVFGLDGDASYRTENTAPYSLSGDTAGDYAPWGLGLGQHTVSATPYAGANGSGGTAGPTVTVTFTIVD